MSLRQAKSPCRICDGIQSSEWLHPREMMFGSREIFSYYRCADCGCLQIEEIPANLDKCYPQDYYSFRKTPSQSLSRLNIKKWKWLRGSMTSHKLGKSNMLGRLLCALNPSWDIPEWLRFLEPPVSLNGGVLDVGCGSGLNLLGLRNNGFTNLLGVDPFIRESISYSGGLRVVKCNLQDIKTRFSLITMHHVFEHLVNPIETLLKARQLLAPGGQILVRIPLSDSFAAQKYRENWVQLDAPRHITLQTRKSMDIIAERVKMKIARVVYDSTEFQFLGSEQYLRNTPLINSPKEEFYNSEAAKLFAVQAQQLNKEQKGDQAAFVFVC